MLGGGAPFQIVTKLSEMVYNMIVAPPPFVIWSRGLTSQYRDNTIRQ